MKDGVRVGRPRGGSYQGNMPRITFRLDEETLAQLAELARRLETDAGAAVRGGRSIVLRKLIADAYASLFAGKEKT